MFTTDLKTPTLGGEALHPPMLSSGEGGLKTLWGGESTSFTHLYYPVIQATHCQINKDLSRTEDILFLEEDVPACFSKHQGTTAFAEALFPR